MHCPRCGALSDEELALARALGPMLQAAARSYLSGSTLDTADGPQNLSRTEEKLFSVLFRASPHLVTSGVLRYSASVGSQASLKSLMVSLRHKLGDEYHVLAVRGVGYRMVWDQSC